MTLSITTLSITTLGISSRMLSGIDAECHVFYIVKLRVIMLNVVVLSVLAPQIVNQWQEFTN